MMSTEELVQAGLCDDSEQDHLTAKSRDWLEALAIGPSSDPGEYENGTADLVLSTSGLFR